MEDVFDVKEAAEYLHCSESTIRKLMKLINGDLLDMYWNLAMKGQKLLLMIHIN